MNVLGGSPHIHTSEAQLTVTESRVVCRTFLFRFSSTSAAFDTFIELSPAMSARVLLQTLFLGSPVLKPHLRKINIILNLFENENNFSNNYNK